MKTRWTIRRKIIIGITAVAVTLLLLAYSGFRGAYAYRDLATLVSLRAAELPLSADVTQAIEELRYRARRQTVDSLPIHVESVEFDQERLKIQLQKVYDALARYEAQLIKSVDAESLLADHRLELQLVRNIEEELGKIRASIQSDQATLDDDASPLQAHLESLAGLGRKLPTVLQQRMAHFREEVRLRYRTWIIMSWASFLTAMTILIFALVYMRLAVILPFKRLLEGCRRVARGEFDHRLDMRTGDELSELASAMNQMTDSFLRIRNNLNREVQQRTREVVRSEQLASVGFLAAGVAHEINNPLASIAWSAEALESRLHDLVHPRDNDERTLPEAEELKVLRVYLKRIQDEAFRCKGITERLLDFSRMGEVRQKQPTDLTSLVEDVIMMVKHLGQYRNKEIRFQAEPGLVAWVIPPEIKQVALNLLTNALDSLEKDGLVTVQLVAEGKSVKLTVEDNGCGMSQEVMDHLFEPFFTRRRGGKGTGLGLSISYRIIQDHGGQIIPSSEGANKGSRFEVMIPKNEPATSSYEKQSQAA